MVALTAWNDVKRKNLGIAGSESAVYPDHAVFGDAINPLLPEVNYGATDRRHCENEQ